MLSSFGKLAWCLLVSQKLVLRKGSIQVSSSSGASGLFLKCMLSLATGNYLPPLWIAKVNSNRLYALGVSWTSPANDSKEGLLKKRLFTRDGCNYRKLQPIKMWGVEPSLHGYICITISHLKLREHLLKRCRKVCKIQRIRAFLYLLVISELLGEQCPITRNINNKIYSPEVSPS